MRNQKSIFYVLFSATATTWVQHIIQAVCGLITIPLLVSSLGKTEYGIWVLIIQAASFLSMSDFGIASSVGRFVAKFRALNDQQYLERLLSTIIILMILAGLLVVLITIALSAWIPDIIKIEKEYRKITEIVFLITGLSMALQFPLRVGMGILAGHQLYGFHGIGKIAGPVFSFIGILLLFYYKSITLVNVAIVSSITAIFANILLMIIAWILTKPWSLKINYFSFPLALDLLSLGGSSLVMSSSSLIYRSGLGIAVGRILGVEVAGVYGVVLAVISNIQPLISSFSTPFTTLASEFHARNAMERIRNTILKLMQLTFSLSISVSAGLYIYGEQILRVFPFSGKWTEIDYHQAGISLSIMGLGLAIGLPQVISQSTLRGIGKHWQVSYAFLTVSIISLFFGIIAMKYGFGIYGAALGWSLFWALQGILFYPAMICKALNYSICHMIKEIYIPGACVGMFVLFMAFFFNQYLGSYNLLNLIIGIVLSAVIGLIVIILTSGFAGLILNKVSNNHF
jgi:O-antigen/teichoic acid export membrane protein